MKYVVFGGLSALLTGLDQWCKNWSEKNLEDGEEREVCKGRIVLRKVHNEGMAFDIGKEKAAWVRVLSGVVCVFLAVTSVLVWKNESCKVKKLGASLMLAGALSNTYDRLVRKHVVDFVGFRVKCEKLKKLTFNLGDFFLMIGAVMTIVAEIVGIFKGKR